MDAFVTAVVDTFALGARDRVTVRPMVGSTNRLWRFEADAGVFVVKELSHDAAGHLTTRQRAARFERSIWESGTVPMPEPMRTGAGDLVVPLPGSRMQTCAVRVHRWLDAAKVTAPTEDFLRAAGSSLHVIQRAGAAWSSEPTGSLRWWDVDPAVVVERLLDSRFLYLGRHAASVASEALAVIDMAEELDGAWSYTHRDHKPENSLDASGVPAILDWDECGHCHPRLEVVEAALRWAGSNAPDRAAFATFLDGYGAAGGNIAGLSPRDFGKWIAALLGWFSFQARRALGDWASDTANERDDAEAMARSAIDELTRSLSSLHTWSTWY